MAETEAQRQGLFIPNWWLAILLIPLVAGIFWVVVTLTQISANQNAMKDSLEFRLKEVETQTKLNNERWLDTQKAYAHLEGRLDEVAKQTREKN